MPFRARMGRNPCCSGPTASTTTGIDCFVILSPVAIPVVVDLLLRPTDGRIKTFRYGIVAIPVVVDLLLRLQRKSS